MIEVFSSLYTTVSHCGCFARWMTPNPPSAIACTTVNSLYSITRTVAQLCSYIEWHTTTPVMVYYAKIIRLGGFCEKYLKALEEKKLPEQLFVQIKDDDLTWWSNFSPSNHVPTEWGPSSSRQQTEQQSIVTNHQWFSLPIVLTTPVAMCPLEVVAINTFSKFIYLFIYLSCNRTHGTTM